jgi:hypothetical protein
MIQSPYTVKNMKITTPMTAAMEMHYWLTDKLGKRQTHVDNTNRLSPTLEKYFSVLDVRKQQEFFNVTLKELSDSMVFMEKKAQDDPRLQKPREDRKRDITQFYLKYPFVDALACSRRCCSSRSRPPTTATSPRSSRRRSSIAACSSAVHKATTSS